MNRKVLLIGGGVLVALCLVCVIIFAVIGGTAFFLTQGPAEVGDKFMTALKAEQWGAAYELCTAGLQKELGTPADLGTLVTRAKATPMSWSITNRNVNNDRAELSGTATFEGGDGTVELALFKSGNDWKVNVFNLTPK